MKPKLYIETSIVSYLVARPSKNIVIAGHQAATQDMWAILGNFEAYISDMVIQPSRVRDIFSSRTRDDSTLPSPGRVGRGNFPLSLSQNRT